MMKKPKIVVCDIDGTLVGFNRQQFTDVTKETIEKLRRNGVYFGIASGRSLETNMYEMYRKWGFNEQFDFLIGANGCELYDGINKEVYNYHSLKRETIKEIYELMKPYGMDSTVYVKDEAWCWTSDPVMVAFFFEHYEGAKFRIVEEVEDMWKHDNSKIMFRTTDEEMPKMIEHVEKYGDASKYIAFRTAPGNLEFTNPKASKGDALKKFCELNAISMDEVIAFGDATNDNSMIEVAGLGVCMIDGTEDTKAIADVLTEKTADEDGFADFVEKYIFTPNNL